VFAFPFAKLIKEESYNDKIPNDHLLHENMESKKREVMNPEQLRFTQPNIAPYFRNPTHPSVAHPSVEETVTLIREGHLDPAVFGELTVHRDKEGVVWCEDNRRLYVLREAGIKSVKVKFNNNDFKSRIQDKEKLNDPAFMPRIRAGGTSTDQITDKCVFPESSSCYEGENESRLLGIVRAVSGAVIVAFAAWGLYNLLTQFDDHNNK
ncbi:hypothetical protein KI387_028161, partial [Taxus chinensis]